MIRSLAPLLPEEAAHRALVEAYVLGLLPRVKRGLRIVVGDLTALARTAVSAPDLVVATDASVATDAANVDAVTRLAGDGVLALVVASPVTHALLHDVRGEAVAATTTTSPDAWPRAQQWASHHPGGVAPPLTPARLARFVEHAEAHGFVLVEGDLATVASPFAHVRGMRSPRARALFATIAMGAAARPLFFVRSVRAPKGGVARAKAERLTDAWITVAGAHAALALNLARESNDALDLALTQAARAVLAEAASSARGPLSFKELLRDARERWSSDARARGARATPSARDARDLALWLHASAASEAIRLHALDPTDPGWELVVAR